MFRIMMFRIIVRVPRRGYIHGAKVRGELLDGASGKRLVRGVLSTEPAVLEFEDDENGNVQVQE
jgi:hypothetical protein